VLLLEFLFGLIFGLGGWFILRYGLGGFYTIAPNERAVVTTFGRAPRMSEDSPPELSGLLRPDERERYNYPQVRVTGPGFYWKFPWQHVHRTSISTVTLSIAYDAQDPTANQAGAVLDAVTKDQLNIGLTGQIRYTVAERNLYAFLFGVKDPVSHVMGYFVSILRDRIANFEAPSQETAAMELAGQNISINDLRKHLRDLNDRMSQECASATARYGIALDAALITGIDPPHEVESALAAINTAHNHVSSQISLSQASADQKIVQSRRAVEIETLNAQAEVEPLLALADQLRALKARGSGALHAYVRNVRLGLLTRAGLVVLPTDREVRS
jgi:regulator of protease activity HflC (stomatin/prohibitin superfamily)